jgi:hypothetical protein
VPWRLSLCTNGLLRESALTLTVTFTRARLANNLNSEASGAVIVDWFYDAAVSGADPIEVRPGFAHLPARIADNGVRTIIVETANRFARDLMVHGPGGRLRNAAEPGRDAGCGRTARHLPR